MNIPRKPTPPKKPEQFVNVARECEYESYVSESLQDALDKLLNILQTQHFQPIRVLDLHKVFVTTDYTGSSIRYTYHYSVKEKNSWYESDLKKYQKQYAEYEKKLEKYSSSVEKEERALLAELRAKYPDL